MSTLKISTAIISQTNNIAAYQNEFLNITGSNRKAQIFFIELNIFFIVFSSGLVSFHDSFRVNCFVAVHAGGRKDRL